MTTPRSVEELDVLNVRSEVAGGRDRVTAVGLLWLAFVCDSRGTSKDHRTAMIQGSWCSSESFLRSRKAVQRLFNCSTGFLEGTRRSWLGQGRTTMRA